MTKALVLAVLLILTLAPPAAAQEPVPSGVPGGVPGGPGDPPPLPPSLHSAHGASWVSRKVLLANVVEGPEPVYPPAAKKAGVFGTVVVEVVVDSEGKVVAALDVEGDEGLGAEAAATVERWRFKPMKADDGNGVVYGSLAFDFGGSDKVDILPSRIDEPPVEVDTPGLYKRIENAGFPNNPTVGGANVVGGLVHVHVTIGPDGAVTNAEVVSGPEPLREAVRSAVSDWTFEPELVDGEEVVAKGDVYLLFEHALAGRLAWDDGSPLHAYHAELPSDVPPPPPPAPPQIIRISGGVMAGKAIRKVEPIYPSSLHDSGIEGRVVVEVTVDHAGKVIAARAVSGQPLLRDAAVDAARQWTFSPTKLAGHPVKVIGTVTLDVRKR